MRAEGAALGCFPGIWGWPYLLNHEKTYILLICNRQTGPNSGARDKPFVANTAGYCFYADETGSVYVCLIC
jgi:hypothetical protein